MGSPIKGAIIRAVVQRVKHCSVYVEEEEASSIDKGLLVLLGVGRDDDESGVTYLSDKILNLRIFPDEQGRMNRSVADIRGELMVVSQFTLLADCRKGRRPSFTGAADPDKAESLYDRFVKEFRASGLVVQTGVFGAMMTVSLENWGPVTLIIDSP